MSTQEIKIGNHTIKFIPHKIMPVNKLFRRTTHYTVEIHRKDLLRKPKLVKKINSCIGPAMATRNILRILTEQQIEVT